MNIPGFTIVEKEKRVMNANSIRIMVEKYRADDPRRRSVRIRISADLVAAMRPDKSHDLYVDLMLPDATRTLDSIVIAPGTASASRKVTQDNTIAANELWDALHLEHGESLFCEAMMTDHGYIIATLPNHVTERISATQRKQHVRAAYRARQEKAGVA